MINNRATRRLAGLLLRRLMPTRPPDFVIGDPAAPYMLRWWLIPRNRWLNVYLHNVRRDDDDRALHDHPWCSLSLMLDGSLGEVWRDRDGQDWLRQMRPGAVVWRGSRFAHRLFLPPSGAGYAWTLFLTGPVVREWGFYCPAGWRHWRDFTAARDGGPGQIGKGCE